MKSPLDTIIIFFLRLFLHKQKLLIIDRNSWIRGEGIAYSRLLRSLDNKKCCLGFYCSSLLGVPDNFLLDHGAPNFVYHEAIRSSWLLKPYSNFVSVSQSCFDITRINDKEIGHTLFLTNNKSMILKNEKMREELLKTKFKEQGVYVYFIN
jgi:hypothetical protein